MSAARVLVVDDNRDMAAGIAMLLEEDGFEAQVAYSGRSALAALEKREFALVLSDVRMSAMSGMDLLAAIRGRWPATPVILLTAYGSIDSAVDAMRTGACDYLTKPFDNAELVRVARRAIRAGAAGAGFDVAAVVGEVAAGVAAGDLLVGLRNALEVLMRATGADDGEIFLCEPEGRDPLLCVCSGPDDAAMVERTRFAIDLGYPGIVAATGTPLCVQGDLAGDARYLRRSVVDAGLRSLVAAPLPDARGVLGSIHLMSRSDGFPVERVLDLLQRAAVPVSSAIRAALGALRQAVDAFGDPLHESGRPLREILELIRQVAGAQYGTLALVDAATGRPNQVVSTGPASLICVHAEAGAWTSCQTVMAAYGFAANPGRREWPEGCRRGLPRRVASPCCLPLVTEGRLYGLVILDFGRGGAEDATGRLVPLLTMANQLAIRLRSAHAGFTVGADRESGDGARVADSAAPELELRCFGPFAIFRRGQPVSGDTFSRSKALTLLKLLALRAGAPVHRDVLSEHLWPEVEPQQGANRLHGVVHDLRSVIEPARDTRDWTYVRNRGEFYCLEVQAPIDIDLVRYRALAAKGLRGAPVAEAIAHLEQLVALYRGDLFEDDPFAEWCAAEREKLRATHVQTLKKLADLHAHQGNGEASLSLLRRALRAEPFRDDLLLAQMELLAQLGRTNEAVAAYDDYQRRLAVELDAAPSAGLRALRSRLLGTGSGRALG
ncbi:MAG: response regulator [Deltaproteobacteria bacterium]|nr:response regulator [Deltaproteobacteria bacterium]